MFRGTLIGTLETERTMARETNQLVARKVANLAEEGDYADGGGLYLTVAKGGSKRWEFWYKHDGKRHKPSIGPYPAISLSDARAKAAALRGRIANGEDIRPSAAKVEPTFGQIADDVLASKLPTLTNSHHRRRWERALKEICLPLRHRPIQSIKRQDVLAVLKPLWDTAPEVADKARGIIARVFARAIATDVYVGNNPADWKNGLRELIDLPDRQRQHYDSMPYPQVPAFMGKLTAQGGIASRALELIILTAVRQQAVREMLWNEVDLDAGLWIIPPDHNKRQGSVRRKHEVPLPSQAVDLLRALPHREGLVFPSGVGTELSQMAFTMAARRVVAPPGVHAKDFKPDFTVHGFRTSFRTWCSETGKNREHAELCMGHQIGNAVEQAYNRTTLLEHRRLIMQEWGDFIRPG